MESLLIKALDSGGVLVLAILIFVRFNQRFDTMVAKLDQLVKLTILSFDSKEKKEKAAEIIEKE